MSLSRHLWHQRQYRRLDRDDGVALLFEHVPTRIDSGDALIVMALMKSTGRRRLRDGRGSPAQIMRCEGR